MKRAFTISTILLSIVVIILLTFLVLQNTKAKMDVIVIKSNQYSITGIDDNNDLIVVESMIQDLSGFRQGQTVKVYYGGVITATWPGRITATKVKLKDDSRIQIADNYLRYAYSNTKNVELDISESTVDEFKFSIVDNNSHFSTLSSTNTNITDSFIKLIFSFIYSFNLSFNSILLVFFFKSFLNNPVFFAIINFFAYPKAGVSISDINSLILVSSNRI